MDAITASALEWSAAALALPGQSESGDHHVVKSFPDGVLVAAVDGIGHGDEAAAAAKVACAILEAHADEPVIALVQRCHESLRATRGAVMSVASFNVPHGLMTWLGVGNVQGILLRPGIATNLAEESLLLRAGVVGSQLPPLQAAVLPVAPGDILILATDGVSSSFARELTQGQPPQETAQGILARHGKGSDDALVLVARYVGNRR